MTPEDRRTAVTQAMETAGITGRPACRFTGLARSSQRYRTRRPARTALRERLHTLAILRPRWGHRRLHLLLRREGHRVNHKLTRRLYREEGLEVRRRRKRVVGARVTTPVVTAANERWRTPLASMDFVRDTLGDERVFRALTGANDFTRECPVIEVDTSLTGERVARVLDRLATTRGLPAGIVSNNGPAFAGQVLDQWAHERRVVLHFIEPGKPVQNAYAECFNGRLRAACLNGSWFTSLADARASIETWRRDYNAARPHSGLAGSTPLAFANAARAGAPFPTTTGPT